MTTASRGTRLALDASPDDHGVFQVVTGGADGLIGRPLAGSDLAAAIADGTPLFIPHRRTCTANKSHNPMPDDVRAEIARGVGPRHPRRDTMTTPETSQTGPSVPADEKWLSDVTAVPIEKIVPNPRNPRREVAVDADLVLSIKAVGVLQPLIVVPDGLADPVDGWERYMVVAGHRRLQAAIKAGLAEVPCMTLAGRDDAPDQIVAMLAENKDRADLTVSEEAGAYQALLDLGLTPAKVAKKTGRSTAHVGDHLVLARQSERVRGYVDNGQAKLSDVAALDEFSDDHEEYEKLAGLIGSPSMFQLHLEYARRRRDRAAAAKAARDELAGRGINAVTLDELGEEIAQEQIDAGVDPDEVDGAADIDDVWEELDAEPDDPKSAEVRALVDVHESEPVVWLRRRPTPEPGSEQEAAQREESAAQARRREEDQAIRQQTEEVAAAARVRWRHLAEQARGVSTAARAEELLRPVVVNLAAERLRQSPLKHEYVRIILGLPEVEVTWVNTRDATPVEDIEKAISRLSRHQLAAVAFLLDEGPQMEMSLLNPHNWRGATGASFGPAVEDWKERLSLEWGYELADIERALVIEGETARAAAALEAENAEDAPADGDVGDGAA
ncbi:ParB/RepB/Spo0J family partition protein [Tomitella gaofuii]|uniref:ParB/RepB/Spo0J family partition protein n=2 Tax=Tomitella gaofuii TaxID=2760083 RepID=UPI0015FD3E2D|nr:ParB/RepB/Spo0J family partition protein [Tomitella gaofuii]